MVDWTGGSWGDLDKVGYSEDGDLKSYLEVVLLLAYEGIVHLAIQKIMYKSLSELCVQRWIPSCLGN